jgi:hypothetical protein
MIFLIYDKKKKKKKKKKRRRRFELNLENLFPWHVCVGVDPKFIK